MSIAAHAGLVVLLLIALSVRPTQVDTKPSPMPLNVVYLQSAGPTGGGGGHKAPASAKRTEVPRHELPKAVPIDPAPVTPEPPRDRPVIDVPVQTDAASVLQPAGANSLSLVPGGGGRRNGAGPGDGDGLGPGRDGGIGGGPRQPGGDITNPSVIRSVEPKYTGAALTAKLTGSVELEVVVLANGTVGAVKVIKSLDKVHGLDQEAINTARQWLFRPSMKDGRPVDVVVRLIIEFNIR
jgi:TonB family protein